MWSLCILGVEPGFSAEEALSILQIFHCYLAFLQEVIQEC